MSGVVGDDDAGMICTESKRPDQMDSLHRFIFDQLVAVGEERQQRRKEAAEIDENHKNKI